MSFIAHQYIVVVHCVCDVIGLQCFCGRYKPKYRLPTKLSLFPGLPTHNPVFGCLQFAKKWKKA